ncbi:hypothetical protein M422DRAFT_266115 [Sphaerobolus stellatus SS14]|uniref:Uncharacterized protein n=1 Tax=Sphaerobolus stellatus (strain SS14) TaxID=990650 RepID=A0A0C9USI5_SPHS4|nr:hypothetical protein M422DRAFT_266115 [Sphaerobolus stellatus SS14]
MVPPSTLLPSLISRIGVIPVTEGRKLYTGRVDPHLTFVAEVCIDVDNAALRTLENRRGHGYYATLRTSSDKLLFLVLQPCASGTDDYAHCWNTLMARQPHPGSAPLTRACLTLAYNTRRVPR